MSMCLFGDGYMLEFFYDWQLTIYHPFSKLPF